MNVLTDENGASRFLFSILHIQVAMSRLINALKRTLLHNSMNLNARINAIVEYSFSA